MFKYLNMIIIHEKNKCWWNMPPSFQAYTSYFYHLSNSKYQFQKRLKETYTLVDGDYTEAGEGGAFPESNWY